VPGVDEAEQALRSAEEASSRWDGEATVAHLSAAIRSLTAAGEPRRAAMACVRLGDTFATAMGNLTAARAWFARARRLVAGEPPCIEQGWVAVAAMGCDVDDPAELLAAAELALDRARRFGDINLETKALADAGLAHVQAGRLAEGVALLDEAMALACGPADDTTTAAKSVCSFFTACYYSGDFGRAASWSELLRRQGLLGLAAGGPVFLSGHCDSVQATCLVELGRWSEAEAVLSEARARFESVMHAPSWHPDIALADLRIRQGRFADAEALLLGKDQSLQALLPAAHLHLARGELELARATARRGLRVLGSDRLRAAELLAVLVDVELAAGDVAAAGSSCAELVARTVALDVPGLQARSACARARLLAATGDFTGSIAVLQAAVDGVDAGQLPFLRATLMLEMARTQDRAGDAGASGTLRAAAGALATLDVVLTPADTALLERSGAGPGRRAQVRTAELGRSGRRWVASFEGTRVQLQDTKGMRYLAALVARPGAEQHALDLVDRVEGGVAAGGPDRRALGDAGEVLDARARREYRHRIEQLRGVADAALADGDLEGAEAAQAELDLLVTELARAFGLGGRERRVSAVAERARLNVTRALRGAISRLAEALPGPGGVLQRRVRTGAYCAYEPDEADGIRWTVRA